MKICVIGAGVIGVSTAYMLARAGHSVTLIDEAKAAATKTSKANGAQLAYSYVEPFASPATARSLPKYFLGLDPGIKLGLTANPVFWKWGMKFLSNCRRKKYLSNFKKRNELAQLSRKTLSIIEAELPMGSLKRTGGGKLVLVDSRKSWKKLIATAPEKTEHGPDLQILYKLQCLDLEPS